MNDHLKEQFKRWLAVPLTYKDTPLLRTLREQPCPPRDKALQRFYPASEEQSCKACGACDGFDFTVSDADWARVVTPLYQEHVVCLACFNGMALAQGIKGVPIQRLTFAGAGVVLQPDLTDKIEQTVQDIWVSCMDSWPKGVASMRSFVGSMVAIGLMTQERAEGLVLRAENICPDKETGHEGGRAWCAYCGDLERPEDKESDAQ